MKKDPPGKTRKFLLYTSLVWVGLCMIYLLIGNVDISFGNFELQLRAGGILPTLRAALMIPIVSIPIIMFFAIVLKLVEQLIDRL